MQPIVILTLFISKKPIVIMETYFGGLVGFYHIYTQSAFLDYIQDAFLIILRSILARAQNLINIYIYIIHDSSQFLYVCPDKFCS